MDLGLTRRNIGRLVLLAWAVMLAWLARRQFAPQGSAGMVERTKRLGPGAQYFAVLAGGRQIGQLNLTSDTLIDVVRLTEQFVLDLPAGDSTRQLARGTEYYLSRALRLRNFTRTGFGSGPAERLDAVLGSDSILGLTDAEGDSSAAGQVRLRIDPDAIMPGMLPYLAAFGNRLRVGEEFSVPLIELGSGGTRPLRVRVTAESSFVVADSASWDSASAHWIPATSDTIRAWRLEHDAPGAPTRSWVDAGGALVRQETAGGLTLLRSAFEIVSNNYRRTRRAESSAWRRAIPGMIALAATGKVPDSSTAVREYLVAADSTMRLEGTARLLEGGRQTLRGDTLRVSRDTETDGDPAESRMARGPSWDLAVLNDAAERAVQEAIGRAATERDSARALTRWVFRQVATDAAPAAFGTARNALRARRANPDGKARLLASMARIAGIPARVVIGVAVLPEGVFSHSWVELWLGRWVAADPSYGQFPASSALIRIAVGERSRPIDLLPLVGSARFLPLRSHR
jgi:transglutaminase-like putative cysteine protease